ncbi:hypothetical protein SO802_034194 [Lithocarpus litseifolius]|uniref:SHSP domain-containing protein n=1 Tax=Lithocarpus litseifolius TaxID=425828 RepID=A0AAW2BFB0_9ROSI
MGFSNGYLQSHPEPQGPFFSGYGITDSGGLYARNNPFQKSGPKGAVIQIALAKNDDLYMRVDMPGVPKDKMFCFGYPYNNVYFGGLAPKEWEYKDEPGCLQALSHPYQTKGPVESFGAIKVETGFYVWVDMPGVTKETVSVRVKDGRVLFAGEAGMDSNQVESGRTYDGSFGPFDVSKLGDINAEMNNGVLRMLINYTK